VVRYGELIKLPLFHQYYDAGGSVRFYFLHDLTDGTAPIGRSMLVKMNHTYRRKSF
jgi:hypothetical protein